MTELKGSLLGNDSKKRIRCRISRPTLDDKFRHLDLGERAFITSIGDRGADPRRDLNGYPESDGSLLI